MSVGPSIHPSFFSITVAALSFKRGHVTRQMFNIVGEQEQGQLGSGRNREAAKCTVQIPQKSGYASYCTESM